MPEIRSDLALKAARAKLIAQAVRRIYLAHGGEFLDKQIHHCDTVLDASILCREAELARAKQGEVLRARGERPHISPSEARINSDKLTRFIERREDLLREARTRINEAINAFDPRDDKEFEAALAFATDTEEAPATTPAKPMRPLMGEGDEVYEMPDMQAIYMSLPEKDRKTFMKAFEEHDAATVEKLLSAQPPEVRKAMVKMTLAA
ncbi:MAG: hypothetical protein IT461_02820 [Planctomycetes bacterium]|nr:hypothetical protein [Planctomycetota bacterium]